MDDAQYKSIMHRKIVLKYWITDAVTENKVFFKIQPGGYVCLVSKKKAI
jgi:hypothetical protein